MPIENIPDNDQRIPVWRGRCDNCGQEGYESEFEPIEYWNILGKSIVSKCPNCDDNRITYWET